MNLLKYVVVCAVGISTAPSVMAEKAGDSVTQSITAILQKPAVPGTCNRLSALIFDGRILSFSNCVMECMGDQQAAKIDDLDIASASQSKHPILDNFAMVEVPCRGDKRCVTLTSSSTLGSKHGNGCAKAEAKTPADAVRFTVNKADVEALLRLIRQVN